MQERKIIIQYIQYCEELRISWRHQTDGSTEQSSAPAILASIFRFASNRQQHEENKERYYSSIYPLRLVLVQCSTIADLCLISQVNCLQGSMAN
jgi:hypothetical protein